MGCLFGSNLKRDYFLTSQDTFTLVLEGLGVDEGLLLLALLGSSSGSATFGFLGGRRSTVLDFQVGNLHLTWVLDIAAADLSSYLLHMALQSHQGTGALPLQIEPRQIRDVLPVCYRA